MDDLISRQAAIDALKPCAGVGNRALDKLRALPSVLERIEKLEQNTGRWKKRKHYVSPLHESFVEDYECSNCHFQYGDLEWNYCPVCGTRMKEDSDDECDLFRRDDDNTIVRTDGKKLYTVDVLDSGEVNAWETRMSRPHREKCWYSDGYEKWVAVVYGRDEKEAKKRAFDLIANKKWEMIEGGETCD